MDTALLLTVFITVALIVATFILINKKNAPREEADTKDEFLPGVELSHGGAADTVGFAPSDDIPAPMCSGPAEDADGPIFPSILPSSDSDLWKVWFDQPAQSKGMTKVQFEDSMRVLGTFNTMADFWDRFSNLMHERLPTKSNVRVFQSQVPPLYEDPINREGGKWIVVIPKQKSVGVFNEVLAAMVGQKFNCEISGLVLSKKVREDLVSIWTPSGIPTQSLESLRDSICDLLETHLGLKPAISFMSHDKKNRQNVPGKAGEKEQNTPKTGSKPAGGKPKFTGVKPKSSVAKPQSPNMKPKSPTLAPTESPLDPPSKPAWGAGVPASVKASRSKDAPSRPKNERRATSVHEESSPADEPTKPAEPEVDADGFMTVQSKPKKGIKGGRRRYDSL